MAEKQGQRHVESSTIEHLPCADEAHEAHVHWSSPPVVHHEEEHDHDHHHKKSILEKVKHKAKKWRQILTKKRHAHDEDGGTPWSTCGAARTGLDGNVEGREADPGYHGAPICESETAPKAYKDHSPRTPNSRLHHIPAAPAKGPRVLHTRHDGDKNPVMHHLDSFKETSHNSTAPATADKAVAEFRAEQAQTIVTNETGNNKTLLATVTEMLTPAYNVVSDATHTIASKIQSPMARDEIGAKMMWDKTVSRSVSMKEYLRNKLEPGEEDRALSEVITEAMSPRDAGPSQGGEMSVVEKVRRALSQLLGKEEEMMGTQPTQVTIIPHQGLKPLQAPEKLHQNPPPVRLSGYIGGGGSSQIPVSTNSYAEVEGTWSKEAPSIR